MTATKEYEQLCPSSSCRGKVLIPADVATEKLRRIYGNDYDIWCPSYNVGCVPLACPDCRARYVYDKDKDKLVSTHCTDARNRHGRSCPKCEGELNTLADHYGGGSHYWVLWCPDCKAKYYYDTYRFKVEETNDKDSFVR